MKLVSDLKVKARTVLLRVDFNVPLDDQGNVLDDFRIERSIPTIEYLLRKGAKVVLMSHLANPKGKKDPRFSLAPVQETLLQYLDCSVTMADDCLGEKIKQWIGEMGEGEVLLLENLRFHQGEQENDPDFSKELAGLGDLYVNDAFSVSHRAHASIVGLPRLLPSAIGLSFKKEINNLSRLFDSSQRPLVGIIGGSKLDSKIGPIKDFLSKVDLLLVGGKIANVILIAKKRVKGTVPLVNEKTRRLMEELDLSDPKLKLPIDALVSDSKGLRVVKFDHEVEAGDVFDIGPETTKNFVEFIQKAKTVFWAGPLGKIEEEPFRRGSLAVARAIAENKGFSVAGGRETLLVLKQSGLDQKIGYLSTGGGAMLEFLAKGTLVGIQALAD
jgi:phosphoglycerate kinase